MKLTPVFQLKINDVFLAEDKYAWKIQSVLPPEQSLELGAKPKPYIIVAERAEKIRQFYYHSCKLVEVQ